MLPVLTTCKQVHREAIHVLYEKVHFQCDIFSDELKISRSIFYKMPPPTRFNSELLTHMDLQTNFEWVLDNWMYKLGDDSSSIRKDLQQLTALRTMNLTVLDRCDILYPPHNDAIHPRAYVLPNQLLFESFIKAIIAALPPAAAVSAAEPLTGAKKWKCLRPAALDAYITKARAWLTTLGDPTSEAGSGKNEDSKVEC